MSVDFRAYPDREMLAMALADRIAGQLTQHLATAERATLCLPGGTTPAPVLDMLSGADLHWDRVTVIPGDERWVPGDHPRSNARLIRRHLFRDRAARATLLGLWTADATPGDAAPGLSAALAPLLPLTVLVLGMGEDGHTASLFPGDPGLATALAADAPPVMAMHPPGADEARMTLTRPALAGALHRHLLITGAGKRAVFEAARQRPPAEAPIAAFLDDLTVHWAE